MPDEESGDFFFDDLATAMDAVQRHITATAVLRSDSVPLLPPGTFCTLISGEVAVSKGRQGAEALNKVQINLLVVRLPNFGTDVLVTLNTPIFISEQSAAAQQAGSGYKNAYSSAPDLFRRIIATLEIRDFGIFGSDATEQ